jgi:signal transduction histidine kinase
MAESFLAPKASACRRSVQTVPITGARPSARPPGPRPTVRSGRLIAGMVAAIALTAAVAYWDGERESASALEDFAQEQATLARGVASNLENRLAGARRDALVADEDARLGRPLHKTITQRYLAVRPRGDADSPLPVPAAPDHDYLLTVPVGPGRVVDLLLPMRDLVASAERIERRGSLVLLIRPPGAAGLFSSEGRLLDAPAVAKAFAGAQNALRLAPTEAARLGIPQRTAVAGLARVDAGPLGGWGVATVATAERQRDRERRARWRLILAVAFAGGLVFAFGGAALRIQRSELLLERELALADLARQRDERLERASKAATMGTLAMGIAHEVSTPLGVISGRAEQLLPRLSGDERSRRAVATILEQSERIGQVIRAFLSLARGDSPPIRETAPQAIISGAMALVEHRFAAVGVSLAKALPADLPALHGDQHLLEHALVNLLLNACDACSRGGLVEVSARVEPGALHITVEDDGAGISALDAARATEPFFTTKSEGGTGLGLAIANEIVKSHRGSLVIAPRATRGTSASIRLPLPTQENA